MLRYVLFVAVVVAGFYIGATELVLNELESVRTMYAHADDIAQNVVGTQSTYITQ